MLNKKIILGVLLIVMLDFTGCSKVIPNQQLPSKTSSQEAINKPEKEIDPLKEKIDNMTMGAIVKNYTINDSAIKSVNAGSDIILVCHGHDNEIGVIDALKKAVENGIISKELVDESVYRILKLKYQYNLSDNILNSFDVAKINSKINMVLDTYLNSK